MSATIVTHGIRASVSNGKWTTDNELLLGMLNELTELYPFTSASDPNVDHVLAQKVVEILGGEVVEADIIDNWPEDVIY